MRRIRQFARVWLTATQPPWLALDPHLTGDPAAVALAAHPFYLIELLANSDAIIVHCRDLTTINPDLL